MRVCYVDDVEGGRRVAAADADAAFALPAQRLYVAAAAEANEARRVQGDMSDDLTEGTAWHLGK